MLEESWSIFVFGGEKNKEQEDNHGVLCISNHASHKS
jgi:hypothetical protein